MKYFNVKVKTQDWCLDKLIEAILREQYWFDAIVYAATAFAVVGLFK